MFCGGFPGGDIPHGGSLGSPAPESSTAPWVWLAGGQVMDFADWPHCAAIDACGLAGALQHKLQAPTQMLGLVGSTALCDSSHVKGLLL